MGYRPTAFYNCAFDEGLIRRTFGIKIEETDLKVVFDKMAQIPDEACQADMKKMEETYNMVPFQKDIWRIIPDFIWP